MTILLECWNVYIKHYNLFLVADCGPIPNIPGRDTSSDGDLSTLYNVQFDNTVEFSCVEGYTPSGTSERGTEIDGGTDQTVSCQLLDGVLYWDLGSLQCAGK